MSYQGRAQESSADECLRLGADESLANLFALFDQPLKSVYRRAGLCVRSVSLSSKRIEQMLAAGTLDGDWIRVEGYAERFGQDLIALPVPLFQLEAALLSLSNSDFDGTPEDLKGRRVGYQAGFRWVEANLPLLGAIPVEIPSAMPVRDLLERNRFEVFATDGVRARFIRFSFADNPDSLRMHTWKHISFYHMLHSRHADKVDALKQAFLVAMEDGTFNPIFSLPGIVRAGQK